MEDVKSILDRIKVSLQEGRSEEEIFQSLLPFIGKDPQWDKALAESIVTLADVRIGKILHRFFKVSKDKTVRKTLRRSLYRLKGKGIEVEEFPSDQERSIFRPLLDRKEGWGSSIDLLGQRFLLLILPHTGRGLTLLEGIYSDTEGLVDFSAQEMARKEFGKFFEELRKQNPFPFVEMEPSYVAFLFSQAYRLTLEKGGRPPQDYFTLKTEIDKIKKEYDKPLVYSHLQIDGIAEDEGMLRRGGELLKAEVFSGWRIEEEQIRPYAEEVWKAEESKIVLTPSQKERRFQDIYQKALFDLFSGERRICYQRRLEEMAYVLFKMGKEEEAKISLRIAMDLEKPLNPIQPNPFLLQLVIKSIFTVLAGAYEKKSKEISLIVKP